MLRGTGVSEGCGIGKALIIQHRSLDYSGVVFGGAQQEKERLRAAINAFMQKTEQLRDRLQASAGEKEAAILDGHMEMLRDPFMLSQMEEMIDGGATAEAAADGVCNRRADPSESQRYCRCARGSAGYYAGCGAGGFGCH